MFKNRRFKHIYNDGNDIGRRKQQKLALCSHVNFLSHTSQCQQFYVFIHIEPHSTDSQREVICLLLCKKQPINNKA